MPWIKKLTEAIFMFQEVWVFLPCDNVTSTQVKDRITSCDPANETPVYIQRQPKWHWIFAGSFGFLLALLAPYEIFSGTFS